MASPAASASKRSDPDFDGLASGKEAGPFVYRAAPQLDPSVAAAAVGPAICACVPAAVVDAAAIVTTSVAAPARRPQAERQREQCEDP